MFPSRFLPTSRLYLGIESGLSWEKRPLTEDELEKHFTTSIQKLWAEYNFDISLRINKAQERALVNVLKDVLVEDQSESEDNNINLELAFQTVDVFLKRRDLEGIIKDYDRFETRYRNSRLIRRVIKNIIDIEDEIKETKRPKAKLEDLISDLYSGEKRIIFKDQGISAQTKQENIIELGSLSSGEKHLLLIFLETLLAEDNIILIDEPELSMHVGWQKLLISSMEVLNPLSQIIIATHSPEIAASVKNEKLFRL